MLTQTSLNGIFCVRFAVGATRTNEIHIQEAFNIIIKEARSAFFEIWDQTTGNEVVINGVALKRLALNRVATAV